MEATFILLFAFQNELRGQHCIYPCRDRLPLDGRGCPADREERNHRGWDSWQKADLNLTCLSSAISIEP
jgi:hypothetical protein